jgi:hypothetical protein
MSTFLKDIERDNYFLKEMVAKTGRDFISEHDKIIREFELSIGTGGALNHEDYLQRVARNRGRRDVLSELLSAIKKQEEYERGERKRLAEELKTIGGV